MIGKRLALIPRHFFTPCHSILGTRHFIFSMPRQRPALVEIGLQERIETEVSEPRSARCGRDPVLLETLLHQRHALGEIVLHHGANLVFDLQITRDFDGRQRFAELGRESALEIDLRLLDRVGFID